MELHEGYLKVIEICISIDFSRQARCKFRDGVALRRHRPVSSSCGLLRLRALGETYRSVQNRTDSKSVAMVVHGGTRLVYQSVPAVDIA